MYSNKDNVNILTALLVKWGVRQAVVCPGSRNAPIVHNLNACAEIDCYPVTDERSAAFFALGMSQIEDEPVVVCVTSGSALLNVSPAVAEAFYQHRRLIVVSADRPASMIGQLQGQTLPQPGALHGIVRRAVNLPEPHDDTERWFCNRLVNEAMIEMQRGDGGPIHINVPISEPLFEFTTESLPDERVVRLHTTESGFDQVNDLEDCFAKSKRPMIIMGQSKPSDNENADNALIDLENYGVVLYEKMAVDLYSVPLHIDEMLLRIEGDEDEYLPDLIVYMGDALVSKRLKSFMRKAKGARVFLVNLDGELRDVSMNVTDVVQVTPVEALCTMAIMVQKKKPTAYHRLWDKLEKDCSVYCDNYTPDYSQMAAVRELCMATAELDCDFQFANSMAVRLGQIYSTRYMFVNRGVNGIEGCLSTAVGFACGIERMVFCVIGDLSFFYDQNALWNNNLTSNLRILLLNNGGGGIFYGLPGLSESAATEQLVVAAHRTTAEGICAQNNVRYLSAHNMEEMEEGIEELMDTDSMVPVLLEVFTDAQEDNRVYKDYFYGERKMMN